MSFCPFLPKLQLFFFFFFCYWTYKIILFRSGNISWYRYVFKWDLRCKLSMRADVVHKPWFHHIGSHARCFISWAKKLSLSIFWHPCFFPLWLLMDLFWNCLIVNVIQVPQPQTPYSVATAAAVLTSVSECVFSVFSQALCAQNASNCHWFAFHWNSWKRKCLRLILGSCWMGQWGRRRISRKWIWDGFGE